MADKPQADRAYSSDVTLAIGMLSVNGDLRTIPVPNKDKESQLHSVCPDCETPTQFMKAALTCEDDASHGPFVKAQIKYGKQVGDKIVVVDPTAAAEARKSVLPEKSLALQVHKREDVANSTFPMGNAYVFTPKGDTRFYAILVELLRKRKDVVLLAKANLNSADHLIMLDLEMDDQLVVRDMIWPEDMKTFEKVAAPEMTQKDKAKLLAQAETLLDVSIEDFDKEEYRKDSKARIAEVIAAADGAPSAKKPKVVAKEKAEDLSAALEAAITARKAS